MKKFVILACWILVASFVLGAYAQLQGIGFDAEKSGLADEAMALGFPKGFWPYLIPIGGAFLLTLNLFLKKRAIRELWRAAAIGKAGAFTAISILFGPLLALLMQAFVVLSAFGLIGKSEMMVLLALLYIFFVLAFGNYVATAKRTIGGGFNTPWTRANDVIWSKTQRFLGNGVVFVSLLAIALLFYLGPKATIFAHFASLIAVKIISAAYSYALWREDRSESSAYR